MTDHTCGPRELQPCPRPFCGGPGRLMELEGFHWVECGACGLSKSVTRYAPSADIEDMVANWNAPRLPASRVLPEILRTRAVRTPGEERLHLLDAAELIERQAAQLALFNPAPSSC